MKSIQTTKRLTLGWAALFCIGIALLLYAGVELWRWYGASHNPNPIITTEEITHSVDEPDETPPVEACAAYTVPATQPRQIEIPAIGVSGCIQRVGIDQNGAIAVPNNIHLAGWYTKSAVPGGEGVSLIDGHVLGRYNDAIFANLNSVQPGDTIRIQMGDLEWREFAVLSRDIYTIEQTASEQLRQVEDAEHQLTLITCGGNWLPAEQTYDQRIVVRSKLIQ